MTVEALTAAAIAKLAFDGFIQAGAGKLTEAALDKSRQLWQKIRGKLQDDSTAGAAIAEVEKQKSQEILEHQVVPFLQVAMLKDSQFAQEIQNIAQQINQEIHSGSQDSITMKNFDVHDNAAVVGKAEGETQYFGGIHEKK
jgi:hypothetical protein